MDKIATTINRAFLREIAAGHKRIEYREIKPYWIRRLKEVKAPFLLRHINGMQLKAPEVTVLTKRVRKNARSGHFEPHIGRVDAIRNWDAKRSRPKKR